MIGDDFVLVSGFTKSWTNVTKKVYALNVKDASATWREMDDVPVPVGFSHAAATIVDNTMYICGGYIGGTPGPQTDICLKYSHTNPLTEQWSYLPSLPEGRGGGGMCFMNSTNSLLFTTGAIRPNGRATDQNTTWELDLSNTMNGWVRRADIPYTGNHVSHVTATYEGKKRHYILGGQKGSNEPYGNKADNFEWDNMNKIWIRRANMTIPRGHASSSTVPYGCGFIMAGGAINNDTQTSDVSYYGIDTDTWISIGNLTQPINTPVCDIARFSPGLDYLYCQSGGISSKFSWRIRISL
jgi:N-acetylneuraminic acid mutarotase